MTHFPEVMQREREREREKWPAHHLASLWQRETADYSRVASGAGEEGAMNRLQVITKWHQIPGFGTEIQGESFKGSPVFHPGKQNFNPSANTAQSFPD